MKKLIVFEVSFFLTDEGRIDLNSLAEKLANVVEIDADNTAAFYELTCDVTTCYKNPKIV